MKAQTRSHREAEGRSDSMITPILRTIRLSILLALLVLAACRPAERPADRADDRPNVILIVLDGARADRFGVYGYEKNTTPRIDEIARRGAVFLNHFSNACLTAKSVPMLMFSTYRPEDIQYELKGPEPEWGIRRLTPESVFQGRPEGVILLPEVMEKAGYQTAIFHNIQEGFVASFDNLQAYFNEVYHLPLPIPSQPRDEALVSTLLRWIRERDGKRPFFAYYHIISPHPPFTLKEEDDLFTEGFDPELIEAVRKTPTGEIGWDEEKTKAARKLYLGNLKHSDRWVGVLFDELAQTSLAEKTIVVITSDHGDLLWEHGRTEKIPWDPLIKIPLVIHYPPELAAGTRVKTPTESVDLMPTLLALAGVKTPPGKIKDGANLLRLIDAPLDEERTIFVHEGAVRDYRYKLFRGVDAEDAVFQEDALFDLAKDPDELSNVIEMKPEKAERLKSRFDAIRSARMRPSRRRSPPEFPFYFTIDLFRAEPPARVKTVENPGEAETPPNKPWLLIRRLDRAGAALARLDGPDPSGLNLSTNLPDGRYRVRLMLETAEHISLNPVELGLRSRFGPEEEYRVPESVEFFGNSPEGRPRYYIDLGGTAVTGERLSLGIDHQPGGGDLHYFRHVKFVPDKIREPIVHRWEDDISSVLEIIGYLDGDEAPAATVTVARAAIPAEIEWEDNLLLQDSVTLTASSYNHDSQKAAALLDNDPDTFWHIDENALGAPAWVKADLGEGNAAAVTAVAARPRADFSFQFFRNAALQASPDGVNWTTLAQIVQSEEPWRGDWSYFGFENQAAYRFYRLLIIDGHQGTEKSFWSMGDLAFFNGRQQTENSQR